MSLREKNSTDLWQTLENIRVAIQATHDSFAEMMKLTPKEYAKFSKSRTSPSILHIFNLLEHVHLSFENVLTGRIDYGALAASHRSKDSGLLPEKYQIAAFSKARTIHHILKYLENFHGWRAAETVIRHFQIPMNILTNPDAPINVKMIAEIFEYTSKYFIHPSLLKTVGSFSRIANAGGPIEAALSKHANVKALYAHVFEDLITRFDENFKYSIESLKGNILKVGVVQKKEIAEALGQTQLSNEEACAIRSGIGASFTGYMGLSHAHAHESKCVHRGDTMCLYEFNFEEAMLEQKTLSKRPRDSLGLLH